MELPRVQNLADRAGVNLVSSLVTTELGWIFREQPTSDLGIDAHIEAVENQCATGRLIGVQIRAGRSRFRRTTRDGFIHTDTQSHLNYWLNHSLPVILVLCDTERAVSYWVHVTEAGIERRPNGRWQIVVPRDQMLGSASGDALRIIAEDRPDIHALLSRPVTLEQLRRESRGRCIIHWMAAGLTESEAAALADDPLVGKPDDWFTAHQGKPVVVVEGSLGAGKSLIVERLLQSAIQAAQQSEEAPLPAYIPAEAMKRSMGQLREVVAAKTSRLGDASIRGAFLVLDGLDEIGWDCATRLFDEARVLLHTWPSSRLVIASRPLPGLAGKDEKVLVPPLSEEEACALVTRVSGEDRDAHTIQRIRHIVRDLPASLRDAVHLPLFAIFLGVLLREESGAVPQSPGEMITRVAHRALRGARADAAIICPVLTKLAALTTSFGGPVPVSELGGLIEARPLLDSRLVVESGGKLAFALPVFAEWFAAESLRSGKPSPRDLADDENQMERWRYPLVILAATGTHEQVSHYLAVLAERRPAFAAEVVRDGLGSVGRGEAAALPPAQECGRRVRTAMQSWATGVGPLAQLIAPVKSDGTVRAVCVAPRNKWLSIAWYYGRGDSQEILPFPPNYWTSPTRFDYRMAMSARPGHQAAWAWQWTHRQLASALSRLLDDRRLPVDSGPLAREAVWEAALALTGRGSLHEKPILLAEIERHIGSIEQHLSPAQRRGSISVSAGHGRRSHDLRWLQHQLERMREEGAGELAPPWPGRDRDLSQYGSWVWSAYSEDGLLRRAEAVYLGAMEGYRQLVETWFPTFAGDLEMWVVMPARFVAVLMPPKSDVGPPSDTDPLIGWYLEALPYGSNNSVEIRLGEHMPSGDAIFSFLRQNREAQRPHTRWSRLSYQGFGPLDIFGTTPATELAYDWLWDDLKRISWVEGLLRKRY